MTKDLAAFAKEKDVKYFMISYTDLFGGQRAKLVPTQAIADMQVEGAGFAGFATWLDFTPAHPDMLAGPRSEQRYTTSLEARSGLGSSKLRNGR
jgi:glutamine synthetase